MALTALELIRGSLRLIGAVGESETVSAEDADNSLLALNEMMEHWNSVPFMTFQVRQDILTWPSATTSRTIGIGGNFSITRPLRLERTCTVTVSGFETELFIIDSRASYDRLRLRSQSTSYVRAIYYDPGVPLGTLYLHNVPSTTATVLLSTPSLLQTFPTLSTPILLPEGYQECMRHNLSIKLSPEFEGVKEVPQNVIQFAQASMAALQDQNRTRISGSVIQNPPASAGP